MSGASRRTHDANAAFFAPRGTVSWAEDQLGAYVYMLRCADKSYYVGSTRRSLDERIAEHEAGLFDGYTAARRPVTLVFHEYCDRIVDAVAAERKLKGWSRAKKEALIAGDFGRIQALARRRTMKRQ